jgi:hypothetical protein
MTNGACDCGQEFIMKNRHRITQRLANCIALLALFCLGHHAIAQPGYIKPDQIKPAQVKPQAIVPGPSQSQPGTEYLYRGNLTLDPGEKTSIFYFSKQYAAQGTHRDASIQVEGFIDGRDAGLTVDPVPGRAANYSYTRRIFNRSYPHQTGGTYFSETFYLPGLAQGVSLRHEGGGRLIIQSIARTKDRPVALPDPGNNPISSSPPVRPPYGGNPGYPEPPSSGFTPPGFIAPQPVIQPIPGPGGYTPQPPQPVYAPVPQHESIVIFRGDLKVRENERSRQFLMPVGKRVEFIEVTWSDKDHDSTGYLLLNNESRSSLPGYDVETPGRVRWSLGRQIDSFRVQARGDHLWVREVRAVFSDRGYGGVGVAPGGYPDPGGYPAPGYSDGPGYGNDVQVFRGGFKVRRHRYSQFFYLDGQRDVERVVVLWTDEREKAVGYVAFDNEPWNVRRGAQVESPGSAEFKVDRKKPQRLRIYARNDDIIVKEIRVYYAPLVYRHGRR